MLTKITAGSAGCPIADHVTGKFKRLNYVAVLFKQPHNGDVRRSASKATFVSSLSSG